MRIECMKNAVEEIFQPIFESRIGSLMEEYQKPELFSAVKDSFVKMMQEIHKQKKVKIEYLGICYMISGLVVGTYELLLGAYGESFYLDKSPVEYYVRIPLFYEWYERDAKEVMEMLKEDFIRIQEWEKDLIRREPIRKHVKIL